jgi:hypothetical protein
MRWCSCSGGVIDIDETEKISKKQQRKIVAKERRIICGHQCQTTTSTTRSINFGEEGNKRVSSLHWCSQVSPWRWWILNLNAFVLNPKRDGRLSRRIREKRLHERSSHDCLVWVYSQLWCKDRERHSPLMLSSIHLDFSATPFWCESCREKGHKPTMITRPNLGYFPWQRDMRFSFDVGSTSTRLMSRQREMLVSSTQSRKTYNTRIESSAFIDPTKTGTNKTTRVLIHLLLNVTRQINWLKEV